MNAIAVAGSINRIDSKNAGAMSSRKLSIDERLLGPPETLLVVACRVFADGEAAS